MKAKDRIEENQQRRRLENLEKSVGTDSTTTATFDTINEETSGSGVTVDGVLIKDGAVYTDVINEDTLNNGVDINGSITVYDATLTVRSGKILETNTIDETTANEGVTVDSVLLKDGTVKVGAGVIGTPSLQIGDSNTGLYKVSSVQTGFSQDGTHVFVTNSAINSGALQVDWLVPMGPWGTTPVGTVSVQEYGDGKDFTTELTLTNFIIGALDGAAAAKGIGNIVYAFPAGQHFELVYSLSSLVLKAAGTPVATDTGLGSVVASGVISALNGTATFEDRLTGQTINTAAAGGAAVSALTAATAGIGAGISLNVAGSVKNVFLNSAGTWNVDNTGNLTATGVIVLKWSRM